MSRPVAPSMPTPKQIEDTHRCVLTLHPGARLVRVGPEGMTYDHPNGQTFAAGANDWTGKPFSDGPA